MFPVWRLWQRLALWWSFHTLIKHGFPKQFDAIPNTQERMRLGEWKETLWLCKMTRRLEAWRNLNSWCFSSTVSVALPISLSSWHTHIHTHTFTHTLPYTHTHTCSYTRFSCLLLILPCFIKAMENRRLLSRVWFRGKKGLYLLLALMHCLFVSRHACVCVNDKLSPRKYENATVFLYGLN